MGDPVTDTAQGEDEERSEFPCWEIGCMKEYLYHCKECDMDLCDNHAKDHREENHEVMECEEE